MIWTDLGAFPDGTFYRPDQDLKSPDQPAQIKRVAEFSLFFTPYLYCVMTQLQLS